MPSKVKNARALVLVLHALIAFGGFAGWFDASAIQSARSLLWAANLGISQIEKRMEQKSKEAKG